MANELQNALLLRDKAEETRSVTCLGMTFKTEHERRHYFTTELRKHLEDSNFLMTPGFPRGDIEDIIRLSDPPYYTACPNPFLADFVHHNGRPYDPDEEYHREPFAVDVSVGKTDQLYRAHSYHTKVPHLAIAPSILHYTRPGEVVLDGFCGSGMTGVAAQWCGTAPDDYRREIEAVWGREGHTPPQWGVRRAVVGDLGPAATFIAANYNLAFDVEEFARAGRKLLDELDRAIGWMYETVHTDGRKGRINFTVWSEVFSCPDCGGEIVFVEEALGSDGKRILKKFCCSHCGAELTKTRLERRMESYFDGGLQKTIVRQKRVPVFINYDVGGSTFEKPVDESDLELLRRIEELPLPAELPIVRMMHAPEETARWGDEWRSGVASFSHVHHLFLPRAAHALSGIWRRIHDEGDVRLRNMLLYFAEQAIWSMALLNRYRPTGYSQVGQYFTGRIRLLSQHAETSPWYVLEGKLGRLASTFSPKPSRPGAAAITTGDCGHLPVPDSSIDYIFTDPPFGNNFAYAELNFIIEAWHAVFTNQGPEAIVSEVQQKGVHEYQELMRRCFNEYHRVLKPGRWITVVFSNSSNAIWHAIQEAMGTAGFVIADVRTLDKQQGTFNQVHGVSVSQDLIISAYKPTDSLVRSFSLGAQPEESAWSFIREHLRNVPVFVGDATSAEPVLERSSQMLYDRMVAFHVQRGIGVPISGPSFLAGLAERFSGRDGMFFLPEQVAAYDKLRIQVAELRQLELFVNDEASAVQWVRRQLQSRPQPFQELQPAFMKQLQAWARHERAIELKEILEQNFLRYDGVGPVPNQIHAYLSTNYKDLRGLEKEDQRLIEKAADRWYVPDPNKQGDLERLRERALLKEFEGYKSTKKKLKEFRTEAIRAGFKAAYEVQNYRTIVEIASKIPEPVLQEDEKLLMYYDVASMRLE